MSSPQRLRAPVAPMLAGKRLPQQSPQTPVVPERPVPSAATARNINLSSTEANTPKFVTTPASGCDSPILLLHCIRPILVCLHLKRWLFNTIPRDVLARESRLLRIDHQEFEKINPKARATLLVLFKGLDMETRVDNKINYQPMTALALLLKGDPRVRWFYTLNSVSLPIGELEDAEILKLAKAIEPGTQNYNRLHAYLTNQFLRDIPLPHHPDYVHAIGITDYAPAIEMSPQEALGALERNQFLHEHASRDGGKSFVTDRYVFELHEADRWLASEVGLHCAEYLMLKRLFFKDFGTECIRNRDVIEPGRHWPPIGGAGGPFAQVMSRANQHDQEQHQQRSGHDALPTPRRSRGGPRKTSRVRTDAAHAHWLEDQLGWKGSKPKKLIAGWKTLGLLEQEKFLTWASAGGMFENLHNRVKINPRSDETEGNVTVTQDQGRA